VRDSNSYWRGLSPKDREKPRFMSRSDALPSELRHNGVLRSSPVSIPHTAVNREWSRGFDPLAGSSPWRSYDLYVVFLRKSLSEAHGGLRVVPGSRQTLRQFL
jgi:hypothetical protein